MSLVQTFRVEYLTYYRLNKEMQWDCSNVFEDLKTARKYLKLELKDLHSMYNRGLIDLPLDELEIEGKIEMKKTITDYSSEVLEIIK